MGEGNGFDSLKGLQAGGRGSESLIHGLGVLVLTLLGKNW